MAPIFDTIIDHISQWTNERLCNSKCVSFGSNDFVGRIGIVSSVVSWDQVALSKLDGTTKTSVLQNFSVSFGLRTSQCEIKKLKLGDLIAVSGMKICCWRTNRRMPLTSSNHIDEPTLPNDLLVKQLPFAECERRKW